MAGPPDFTVGLKPILPEAWLTPDTETAALPAFVAVTTLGALDVPTA